MSHDSFLPYAHPTVTPEDRDAVLKVFESDFLTEGKWIDTFEKNLTDYLGCQTTVAVSSGTAALHLACLSLELSSDDVVIVPALTFVATANCVLYSGGKVIFADVDRESLCLSHESVIEAYDLALRKNLRPRAVITVSYAGYPGTHPKLKEVCEKRELLLIEDNSHALGAEFRNSESENFKKVGCDSHISIASFHPVKHITSGEGGSLSTSSVELGERFKALRNHGFVKEPSQFEDSRTAYDENGLLNPWYREMKYLGYQYRMSELQAALGVSQLKKLDFFVRARRKWAELYRNHLKHEAIELPPIDGVLSKQCYHLFPIQIDFKDFNRTRASFMESLKAKGIGTQVHYPPVFFHPYYRKNDHLWFRVVCKNTLYFYDRALSIPMYSDLNEHAIERVSFEVLSLLNHY